MNCENIPWYALVIGQCFYMLLEFWFGKTDKMKSGSLVEIIINLLMKVFNGLFKKENK